MSVQMALDELLFEGQIQKPQPPVLRFYLSSGPWISAGCSYRDANDLAKSALVRAHPEVPVCRRVTGGGCVRHGEDLIFSLIARYESERDPLGSVRTSYRKIHEGVRIALENFGVMAGFYSEQDLLPRGSDCFRFPVASDLYEQGRKIAGGAQKRSRSVLLHHESIQLNRRGLEREALSRVVADGVLRVLGWEGEPGVLDIDLYFKSLRMAANTRFTPRGCETGEKVRRQ